MKLKSDLNKYISKIWLLYTNSYEYYNCLIQTKNHQKSEFEDSRFKSFIIYSSWYILIIELSKVYHDSKSQHYNIYGLINRLINEHKNLEFKSFLTLADLNKYKSDFNSPEIIGIRSKLITLRDKFYAHTDKLDENFITTINIKLGEIELLLKILRGFIFDIKSKVFNTHTSFEDDIFVNIDSVFQRVEDYREKFHSDIIKKFNEERKSFNSQPDKIYTFHVDFRGGTYCTQVFAKDLDESLIKWIERLKIEKKDIKFLGDKTIEQLEKQIGDSDERPVLLTGLLNIWCATYSTRKGFFWVHIIQTNDK